MTSPRIALVDSPDWPGVEHAQRALGALLPEAEIRHLPQSAAPTPDLDGLWLLTPPPSAPSTVHDTALSWALSLGLPFVGPTAAGDEGGDTPFVRAMPGSRLARHVGEAPRELPVAPAGGRAAREYLTAPGTVWFPEAHRGREPATVTAGGAPFATLADHPWATEQGVHPLLLDFASTVRSHAAARQQPAPAAAPTTSLAPLPDDEPRSYVHQVRTRGYRWWRPLIALLVAIGTFMVISMALTALWFVLDPSLLEATSASAMDEINPADPVVMLISNLTLAALIPATLLATRVGHWRPMGKIWSVTGRIRWMWLLRAGVITLVVWGAYLAASWLLSGQEQTARPEHWQWLLVITLLTTPLQAAGEEVAFRGGLMQGVGAWIRNPVVALVVGTVLSAGLFALAHTSLDPWILLDLGAMAVACCYLTWRTGGLEAAIVLHVVNNLVITVGLTLLGGLEGAYVTGETSSTVGAAGLSVLATFVMTLILLHQARRAGVAPGRIGTPARG